MDIDINKRCRR